MKTAIPWILAAGLLAGVVYFYSEGRSKDADIAQLRQENAEVDSLRSENEQLKKTPDQSEEIARLQKDNEDLLRLRGEVSQLRQDNEKLGRQLQTVQAQNGQIVQQQQQTAAQNEALRAQTQQMQQSQAQALADACVKNLRLIDAAKQQWALENKKPADAIPAVSDLVPYMPNNTFPACPDGGTYSINPLTTLPTCTIPGHVLPRQN